jgi:hypothetical protein
MPSRRALPSGILPSGRSMLACFGILPALRQQGRLDWHGPGPSQSIGTRSGTTVVAAERSRGHLARRSERNPPHGQSTSMSSTQAGRSGSRSSSV